MTEAATGAPMSAAPEAAVPSVAGESGGTFSSFGNFLNSPYGKLAAKMVTGGGGKKGGQGEQQQEGSVLQKGLGSLSNASKKQDDARKQRMIQALVASGMDPNLAQQLAGGA